MRARILALLLVPLLLSQGCAIPEGVVPLINSFLNRRANNASPAPAAPPAVTSTGTITAPGAAGAGIEARQPTARPQQTDVTAGTGVAR